MKYTFTANGHKNITAKHKNTLEITKDTQLTEKGDCIVAVNANFELNKINEIIKNNSHLTVTLSCNNQTDTIEALINPDFNDEKEIVLRISNYISNRTLGMRASKSSAQLSKKLIEQFKNPENNIKITLSADTKKKQ